MGPPYTEAEERDLYRRIASGPRTADPEAAATNLNRSAKPAP